MCRFSQLGVTHSGLDTARVGALRVWGWSAVQRTGYDPRAPPWVVGGRHPPTATPWGLRVPSPNTQFGRLLDYLNTWDGPSPT